MNTKLVRLIALSCPVLIPAFVVSEASGTILTFQATSVYSGDAPVGPAPWLTLTFDDQGGTGSVVMTFTASSLSGSEFVSGLYFNLDPALNPRDLVFSDVTKDGNFSKPTIHLGRDDFKAGGGGYYDVMIDFATSNSSNKRFDGDDSAAYTISGISSLTAASFVFYSRPSGGAGSLLAAAHVQGINPNQSCQDDQSGWVAFEIQAPEPATMSFLAFGSLAMLIRRR